MKPVLTADEYRRIDKAYEGDLIQAMDRAGYAVALAAVRAGAGYGTRVVVLAGPGNNGGDGYVAARYLKQRGVSVEVQAFSPPRTPEAIDAAAKARSVGVRTADFGVPADEDLVIDAIFGGGGRTELPESIVRWMDTDSNIVSVDYPTGLDPNTGNVESVAFHAVETVTFGALKTGHVRGLGPDYCGTVTIADIGINGGETKHVHCREGDRRPTTPERSKCPQVVCRSCPDRRWVNRHDRCLGVCRAERSQIRGRFGCRRLA